MVDARTRWSALAGSLLLGAAAVATAVPAAAESFSGPVQPAAPFLSTPQLPEFDAFYRPPAEVIAARQPGEIIAAREVRVATFSAIPVNVDAWQVSYRSDDSYDQPIAAVATVLKPRDQVPRGARNLLSFQMAEDSTGQYCASSYSVQQWSIPGLLSGQAVASISFMETQVALQQGWAVVIPDHQGPNAAFAHGPLAGRITLDGIRAAENFDQLGLDGAATKVGMMGYSGGSVPTMHAAELARTYAPELNIVGAASGGTDADLGALVNLANNNAASGLILAGIIGLAHEEPEFDAFLHRVGTPLAQGLLAAKDRMCVTYQALTLPFMNIKGLLDTPGDPMDAPEARYVLDRTRMGKSTPTMPVYLYQANMDWLVPVGPVNALYGTYCQDPDARITYTRDNLSEHLSLEAIALPSVMLWMRDRFAGVPASNGCTLNDVGSMTLDQRTWSEWVSIVGETVAGLFGKPLGVK
ncbi:lipase family protein [Nocardia jejuensis]|uniref:lipase family protein n=1 Tax=Nocardia jejuensis TaxID=328049 RepID=UPI0008337FF0|nr:lipase family protein [Nocardia jejuensis]